MPSQFSVIFWTFFSPIFAGILKWQSNRFFVVFAFKINKTFGRNIHFPTVIHRFAIFCDKKNQDFSFRFVFCFFFFFCYVSLPLFCCIFHSFIVFLILFIHHFFFFQRFIKHHWDVSIFFLYFLCLFHNNLIR